MTDLERQLNATKHSLCEVEGAYGMEQTATSNRGARVVTTRWYDLANQTLRQDTAVLVDSLPIVGR